MNTELVLSAVAWGLILFVPLNTYILWHGWVMNRTVTPRSPVLRALLYVKFSVWLMGLYFAIIGFRYLADLEPILPFGGLGLGVVMLFAVLTPTVIHSQMRRFVDGEL